MLYKVTPAMQPQEPEKKKAREPGQARPKRKSAIYNSDGEEVLLSLMCLKCRQLKPLAQFGLRKMADGAIRNQPWCRGCRSAASSKKKGEAVDSPALAMVPAHPAEAEVELETPVQEGESFLEASLGEVQAVTVLEERGAEV